MTIKEVSEQYDISADTLRYYERIGLIPVSYTHLDVYKRQPNDCLKPLYTIAGSPASLTVYF